MVAAAVLQGRGAERVARPPVVLDFIKKTRGDQENPVVKWAQWAIRRHVAGGRALDAGGRMLTADLWAAWCTYNGEPPDTPANTKVDGFDKGAVTTAVRKALNLPAPSVIRTNHGQGKGWYGVEIAPPETADDPANEAADDAPPPCCPHGPEDHVEGDCIHAACECAGRAHPSSSAAPSQPLRDELDARIKTYEQIRLADRAAFVDSGAVERLGAYEHVPPADREAFVANGGLEPVQEDIDAVLRQAAQDRCLDGLRAFRTSKPDVALYGARLEFLGGHQAVIDLFERLSERIHPDTLHAVDWRRLSWDLGRQVENEVTESAPERRAGAFAWLLAKVAPRPPLEGATE